MFKLINHTPFVRHRAGGPIQHRLYKNDTKEQILDIACLRDPDFLPGVFKAAYLTPGSLQPQSILKGLPFVLMYN